MKTCTVCGETKETELFTRQGKYYRGICRKCNSARVMGYQKGNVETRKNWDRHKIGKEKYDSLLLKHQGMCHVCKKNPAKHIDHDHSCCDKATSCGKCVRGLLCQHCNLMIGQARNDVKVLAQAIKYLNGPLV